MVGSSFLLIVLQNDYSLRRRAATAAESAARPEPNKTMVTGSGIAGGGDEGGRGVAVGGSGIAVPSGVFVGVGEGSSGTFVGVLVGGSTVGVSVGGTSVGVDVGGSVAVVSAAGGAP